jgi:large subunit ribosomal protein L13
MATGTKSYQTRASDLKPAWHVIDAEGQTLGRLASHISVLLQGKHKPIYVPYLNTGDFVVVINADKVRVSGRKMEQKLYRRHSGYHGGLREQTLTQLLAKHPTRAITLAVKGMLPHNTMGKHMLGRLKVYAGNTHPHQAQVAAGQRRSRVPKAEAEPVLAALEQPQEAAPAVAQQIGAQEAAPEVAQQPVAQQPVAQQPVAQQPVAQQPAPEAAPQERKEA